MKLNPVIRIFTATAISFMAFSAAHGADAASEASKRADNQYKVAQQRCEAMKGNAKDVCGQEAKAARDKTKADVRATTKGTPEARADAGETKAKADYKVAMERCDTLKGKEQNACESRAKATLDSRQSSAEKARMRGQDSVGEYTSDAAITTAIKSKYAVDSSVAATAIGVETADGIVQLSGFAKNAEEKSRAEVLAKQAKGVKSVRNNIIVRP